LESRDKGKEEATFKKALEIIKKESRDNINNSKMAEDLDTRKEDNYNVIAEAIKTGKPSSKNIREAFADTVTVKPSNTKSH
jgi:hypothetical protein